MTGSLVLVLCLSAAVQAQVGTFHVDGVNGSDSNSGLSRNTAFETIQKGIISAQDGDTVLVWPGVYDMPSNFMGKAITVRSAADAAVLETESNYAVSFYSGEGPDSVLENFVIRNCYAGIQAVGTSPTIRFVTVVNNDHGIIADITATPYISNSILWNNTYGDLIDCEATYSCIQDGDLGIGNISVDPDFADRANGDFHLLSERGRYMPVDPCDFGGKEGFWVLDEVTSPCIDGGDPGMDESGERMPNGVRLNMGAYGGTGYASMSEWPLAADLNLDGTVNLLDFAVTANQWLADAKSYTLEGSRHIHRGIAEVDGDLSEWTTHTEWIYLDQIYNIGEPNDITEAKVAFRWDAFTNKVYAAVIVTDTDHVFTDDYEFWEASDRIEIHSQGSAAGGTGFYGNYGIAQHYMVGPDTTGGCWGTWALGQTIDADANFEYAVQVVGNQIHYEIGVSQFDYYGGIAGGDSILTPLYPYRTIRLDIIASTRHAEGFGMLAENLMRDKYIDAGQFAPYWLVE